MGNSSNVEDFLNSFISRSRLCTDEDRLYWFGILCGAAFALWFERAKFPTWEAACKAFKAGYTIQVHTKDALQLASALTKADYESVVSYIARFERKLGNVKVEAHKDLFLDVLFDGILPILLFLGAHLRSSQLPWGELTRRLIELKWTLGGPGPALNPSSRCAWTQVAFNGALNADHPDSRKRTRTREEKGGLQTV